MTDKRDESGETDEGTEDHADVVMLDMLNFIIDESRSIRRDMAGDVWKKDGLAYRMMTIENLAQTAIDSRFEFTTEGIDPVMNEDEIESFWSE